MTLGIQTSVLATALLWIKHLIIVPIETGVLFQDKSTRWNW